MTSMTNVKHKTSKQHIEFLTSRSNRDFADLNTIQEWLDQHEPFTLNEPRLRSLSSGLMASDGGGINCNKTEEVGVHIHRKIDNMSAVEASIKRSDQVKSLDHLHPGIKVDKQKINIHPNHLFYHLMTIEQRDENMAPYFDYELTAMPTLLFKDNFMCKSVKSQLAQALEKDVQSAGETPKAIHVLDGGALIHKVKCKLCAYKVSRLLYCV